MVPDLLPQGLQLLQVPPHPARWFLYAAREVWDAEDAARGVVLAPMV